MKNRTCAVFVFDGFADHEVALTMACLNTESDFAIETFSDRGRPVTSLSGLRVTPHTSLQNIDPEYFDLLLLPGGSQWEKGDNLEIFPLIRATAGKKPIAAICGATLALGDLGLLNEIPHTSNFPGYIGQYCKDYEGMDYYRPVSLVNAGDIITASGVAIADLAYEILRTFGILEPSLNWAEPSCEQ
ncbi:MAG TPA: DJ-1/PfpI family protein [Puia sp.]